MYPFHTYAPALRVGSPKVTRNFEVTTTWDNTIESIGGKAHATLTQDGRVVVHITRNTGTGGVKFELRSPNVQELQALVRTLEAASDELAERRS